MGRQTVLGSAASREKGAQLPRDAAPACLQGEIPLSVGQGIVALSVHTKERRADFCLIF